MIRNLKILLVAAIALLALSGMGTAVAQASEIGGVGEGGGEELTITATPDGTLKTAHHVIDIPGNISITCNGLGLDGHVKGRVAKITMVPTYNGCTFNGAANVPVEMNACDYFFYANGEFEIGSREGENCGLKPMTFKGNLCDVKFGPQKLKGITYHNIVVGGVEEVTIEMSIKGISGVAEGAGCPVPGAFTTGEYTTGNTILTGAKAANPNMMVNINWTP